MVTIQCFLTFCAEDDVNKHRNTFDKSVMQFRECPGQNENTSPKNNRIIAVRIMARKRR